MDSRADVHNIVYGTGYQIFQSTILPAIESAQHEVQFVTCFWAASKSKDALNESLIKLSNAALQRKTKIKVRIGFSSCSLLQKLFHTRSPEGHTYDASTWQKKLGLPGKNDISGLDLEIRSIFFLPFSVWHPKFVIIDNREVFLPSCNVSWEEWFEGCVHMTGPVVQQFTTFWNNHWASTADRNDAPKPLPSHESIPQLANLMCKFLPSPHHRNPNFRLPWQNCAPPPQTPLNIELLELFNHARRSIFIQTPNLTCPPVLDALVAALERGVDVRVTTSERLMILEQLVTAGTTTSRCVKRLIRTYERLRSRPLDEEAGFRKPGLLHISYYEPRKERTKGVTEPVQSHLKLTAVDDEIVVFGSGNMDRASWFASQELGVSFHSKEMVRTSLELLEKEMVGRSKIVFDGEKH
ncbi:unnamed protein product [Zymoseptoria tritici ST99CH_1A5]|uniref:PLD phosphodiesterase domain-containing protein n=1 Tax=Zymoseptoria tritici ST99CH_1A5 TaxID=1276529 RepID=A0A1Y6L3L2_ZYMTR|nr:unnamed protein product [Zymoseptoria tritici ST99CH_1A5]